MSSNKPTSKDRPNLVCYKDIANNPTLTQEVEKRKKLLPNYTQSTGKGKAIHLYLSIYRRLKLDIPCCVATKDIVEYMAQFKQATGEELEVIEIKENIYSVTLKNK